MLAAARRRTCGAVLSVAMLVVASLGASAGREPGLGEVLSRAARRTTQLHRQLATLVAEESYVQQLRFAANRQSRPADSSRRTLTSDLLLVAPDPGGRYVEFRDVFEVDGAAVRDRDQRLASLFMTPTPGGRQRLESIIRESARYNLGDIPRNINTPMLTLSFLLPDAQRRFRFRRAESRAPQLEQQGASDTASGPVFRVTATMWTVAFEEVRRPTVIRTNGGHDFPARGRFWLDPDTGAVLMSELEMDNGVVAATINVSYQSEPLLGFLVPVEMRERYEAASGGIDGVARYGRFRQFQVKTTELLGRPPGR